MSPPGARAQNPRAAADSRSCGPPAAAPPGSRAGPSRGAWPASRARPYRAPSFAAPAQLRPPPPPPPRGLSAPGDRSSAGSPPEGLPGPPRALSRRGDARAAGAGDRRERSRPADAAAGRRDRSRSPRVPQGYASREQLADWQKLSIQLATTCRYAQCAFVSVLCSPCCACRNYEKLRLAPVGVEHLGQGCGWFRVLLLPSVLLCCSALLRSWSSRSASGEAPKMS